MLCPLPTSTLFPYTTLFRSDVISQRPLDWARLGLGKIQLAEQDYDAAIATFKALLEDNNQCIEAYDWLAQAYQKQRSEGTRLNSSHVRISYAVFCLKKKKN